MAVAVIGGVIVSTFLTLLVVPVVYTWMDRLTLKKKSSASIDVSRRVVEELDEAPKTISPEPESVPTAASVGALRR